MADDQYSNVQYYNDPYGKQIGIKFEFNGMTNFVPLDPNNTDYKNIMELVNSGQLIIAPTT